MKTALPLFALALLGYATAFAELRVPASTAYIEPDANGAKVSKEGISEWTNPAMHVLWFGECKMPGKLEASVVVRLPRGAVSQLQMFVALEEPNPPRISAARVGNPVTILHKVEVTGTGEAQTVKFGEFNVEKAGYVRCTLVSLNAAGQPAGDLQALILDGPATADAHFNPDRRRNAASVHLSYATPKDAPVTLFYNEVTAVTDPVASYYMACGFARGYFGMQVNSPTERRIIFSVWDAGNEGVDRAKVGAENRVKLLAKGEGVDAGDFGNEGTGGHSHLVYPWKTGATQRFCVRATASGELTDYEGWWFHPEKKKWMLIASFRASHDGKWLRGLYSFSENFSGSNGQLQRKALFGPAWLQTADRKWREITEASFSHDGTGKANRLDRFMGLEGGRFFLSNGGFVPGFTKYGEKFTRPASGLPPADLKLPTHEPPAPASGLKTIFP